jgi:cbb3-type cytochrome oxidase subunit 3
MRFARFAPYSFTIDDMMVSPFFVSGIAWALRPEKRPRGSGRQRR